MDVDRLFRCPSKSVGYTWRWIFKAVEKRLPEKTLPEPLSAYVAGAYNTLGSVVQGVAIIRDYLIQGLLPCIHALLATFILMS